MTQEPAVAIIGAGFGGISWASSSPEPESRT